MCNDPERKLILRLFEVDGIKFEDVVLKTGVTSPIYVDLRVLVSYPLLMKEVAHLLCQKIEEKDLKFKSVCGVPYTALPIATAVSLELETPMLMVRQEAKSYGTKKRVEGAFSDGDVVLVIEDVLTSGTSILEIVNGLTACKLRVTDVVVVLDRNQNGAHNLQSVNLPEAGIRAHSLFDLRLVTKVLLEEGKITAEKAVDVEKWLQSNPAQMTALSLDQKRIVSGETQRLTFDQRISAASNKLTLKLLDIIQQKRSNVCLAADFQTADEILRIADGTGPHIAMLKVHADIVRDFSDDFVLKLQSIAKKHNFLLFEDRKFADTGNTVRLQYSSGLFKIQEWADVVTCHIGPGDTVIRGLKSCLTGGSARAAVLVAEMSCAGSHLKQESIQAAYAMAQTHSDFVMGFVCQNKMTTNPEMMHMTPGVAFETGSDGLGQQFVSADQAIANGADVLIVGRAITASPDPVRAAILMKERAFSAYLNQCAD